ncbi:MAG: bacteriohemerythrin [Bacteroidetes bacterium]|nr:bacteriohemerythrin [Bacteroidota bacterium]MCA0447241.1 bacteriohemerythrin [Bacteroidota bacterium]
MAFWVWDNGLNTGIQEIDSQHKRIVDYVNQLDEAIAVNKTNERIGVILDDLIDYTYSHFIFEETLMEQAGYPMIDPHKKLHEAFRNRVQSLKTRFDRGEDVALIVRSELKVWLTNHIKGDDVFYVPSVKKSLNPSFMSRTLKNIFG